MAEIWKDVVGYEGLYKVSDKGNVYSNVTERQLIPIDYIGYKRVRLYKDKKGKTLKIHRLVAQAFIPNPENKPQINHLDENPSNNCVENLEWCTAKENCNYGNHAENIAKKTRRPVTNGINDYISVREACKQTGIQISHISECCNGIRKTAGGYTWYYI